MYNKKEMLLFMFNLILIIPLTATLCLVYLCTQIFKGFSLFFFINKAKYIQEKIGYQDFILNTTALDEYYENVSEMINECFVFSK